MSSVLSDHLKNTRAFAVWFKDLPVWSVAGFRRIHWQWPEDYIGPLASALTRRSDEVDRRERRLEELQLVTIHFDGTLEARSVKPNSEFKGRLFFAAPGDVVYSKIDVRNGAIAIVPEQMTNAVVSSEFPVYRVSHQVALPGYIKLLFKTSYFRHAINGMISGASGRKRVQPDQLTSLEVPLPPLSIQRNIFNRWELVSRRIVESQNLIALRNRKRDECFLDALGLETFGKQTAARAFGVLWKDFLRWSVSYNQVAAASPNISCGKYPIVEVGSVLDLVQYGTSEKAGVSDDGTPILRMNNIVDGNLDLTHLKYISLPERVRTKLLLRDGDILFNRTNSKELVGKCAVFHEKGDYVFASYLIRLRLVANRALPDFVAFAINSSIGRSQIDALSRQIIGQANINSQELRSLQIPLPPLSAQREIMEGITKSQKELLKERERTQQLQTQVETEVEEMILGVRPVTDVGPQLEESHI